MKRSAERRGREWNRGVPFGLCAAVLLGVAASSAHAETAVLLPHSGDPQLMALREAAQAAARTALAEQGVDVRPYAPQPRAPKGDVKGCAQIACAPALLAALPAEVAVAVAVWYGKDKPQVNVTLVDAAGNRFPDVAAVDGEGADGATRAALVGARALQLLGPGPWVEVRGSPEGASVVLDGKVIGTLPYRGALGSGDHRLEIRANGFATQEYAVQMPLDPTTVTRIALALAPGTSAPAPAEAAAAATPVTQAAGAATPAAIDAEPALDEASPWNYAIGGVLAAGGIALATIDPIRASARDGECANDECSRVYRFGSESLVKIALGGVLLAGGVIVMLWRPLRVDAELSDDSAALRVRGTF